MKIALLMAFAVVLGSCRNDTPPPMEICIVDGLGGGDCVEADGTDLYRPPSEMKNYWATSPTGIKGFSSWCYDTNPANVDAVLIKVQEKAHANAQLRLPEAAK